LKTFKTRMINVTIGVTLLIVILINLLPMFHMFVLSIKPAKLIFEYPVGFSFKPTLEAYRRLFTFGEYYKFFINSFLVATGATVLSLTIGSLAAFAFVFFPFRGKGALLFASLFTRMYPPVSTIIPIFFIMRYMRLLDTPQALLIVYTGFNIPLALLIMKTFFADIPSAIQESALLDGCSPLGLFVRVVLPLSWPGLIASALLVFVFSWNEFIFALVLTSFRAKTAPVAIMAFIETEAMVRWNTVAALGLVTVLPAVLFTVLLHKFLVRGLTVGAVKG